MPDAPVSFLAEMNDVNQEWWIVDPVATVAVRFAGEDRVEPVTTVGGWHVPQELFVEGVFRLHTPCPTPSCVAHRSRDGVSHCLRCGGYPFPGSVTRSATLWAGPYPLELLTGNDGSEWPDHDAIVRYHDEDEWLVSLAESEDTFSVTLPPGADVGRYAFRIISHERVASSVTVSA